MSGFDERDHPRGRDGRFSDKDASGPSGIDDLPPYGGDDGWWADGEDESPEEIHDQCMVDDITAGCFDADDLLDAVRNPSDQTRLAALRTGLLDESAVNHLREHGGPSVRQAADDIARRAAEDERRFGPRLEAIRNGECDQREAEDAMRSMYAPAITAGLESGYATEWDANHFSRHTDMAVRVAALLSERMSDDRVEALLTDPSPWVRRHAYDAWQADPVPSCRAARNEEDPETAIAAIESGRLDRATLETIRLHHASDPKVTGAVDQAYATGCFIDVDEPLLEANGSLNPYWETHDYPLTPYD